MGTKNLNRMPLQELSIFNVSKLVD